MTNATPRGIAVITGSSTGIGHTTALRVVLHQLMHDLERGSEPSLVADCVANAITTGDPQLRYLVGQGAERNLRVRTSMTDQEYLDVHRLPVEEQIRVLLDGET
jgi:NAD(P)-dependent dehydrogenase (short-subunit alcohol dehydrogenase family)